MSGFGGFILTQFWAYTKLTFWLLWRLTQLITLLVSGVLNRRQRNLPNEQANLFDRSTAGGQQPYGRQ